MAAHVLLILEIFRPRLLSGLVRSVQFRALPDAVDILVDVRIDEPIAYLAAGTKDFRPSLRGVCVRSGRKPCHHTIIFPTAGGPSICCVRWSNEAATANADIEADHLDVPVHLV